MNKIPTKTYSGVALLDEHELTDSDGQVELDVDEQFLEDVARRNNERYLTTGDATPVVLGHTRDGIDEKQQPEVVGFATNFRVEKFSATGKKAIFADLHIYRDRSDEVERQYPRRSVELWVRRREIDPISLLGATTPERDLGPLVKFRRGADTCYRYSLADTYAKSVKAQNRIDPQALTDSQQPNANPTSTLSGTSMNPDATPMDNAMAGETAPIKALEAQVSKLTMLMETLISALTGAPDGEDEDELLGPGPDDDTDPVDDGDGDQADDMEDEMNEDADEDAAQDPSKDAAKYRDNPVKMGAMPGPSSGYVPGTPAKHSHSKYSRETAPNRTPSRTTPVPAKAPAATGARTPQPEATAPVKTTNQTPEQIKLQRQVDKQNKELAELKLKLSRTEAEKVIDQLASEGYEFADKNTEVTILTEMGVETQSGKDFIEKIVKRNYKRSLEAESLEADRLVQFSRHDGSENVSPEAARRAADAVSRGKFATLDEALAKLAGR